LTLWLFWLPSGLISPKPPKEWPSLFFLEIAMIFSDFSFFSQRFSELFEINQKNIYKGGCKELKGPPESSLLFHGIVLPYCPWSLSIVLLLWVRPKILTVAKRQGAEHSQIVTRLSLNIYHNNSVCLFTPPSPQVGLGPDQPHITPLSCMGNRVSLHYTHAFLSYPLSTLSGHFGVSIIIKLVNIPFINISYLVCFL